MRVLNFNAKVVVHLEAASSMTTEGIAEQVADELCRGADVPQADGVVDYSIKDISVCFLRESKPVPDDLDDEKLQESSE